MPKLYDDFQLPVQRIVSDAFQIPLTPEETSAIALLAKIYEKKIQQALQPDSDPDSSYWFDDKGMLTHIGPENSQDATIDLTSINGGIGHILEKAKTDSSLIQSTLLGSYALGDHAGLENFKRLSVASLLVFLLNKAVFEGSIDQDDQASLEKILSNYSQTEDFQSQEGIGITLFIAKHMQLLKKAQSTLVSHILPTEQQTKIDKVVDKALELLNPAKITESKTKQTMDQSYKNIAKKLSVYDPNLIRTIQRQIQNYAYALKQPDNDNPDQYKNQIKEEIMLHCFIQNIRTQNQRAKAEKAKAERAERNANQRRMIFDRTWTTLLQIFTLGLANLSSTFRKERRRAWDRNNYLTNNQLVREGWGFGDTHGPSVHEDSGFKDKPQTPSSSFRHEAINPAPQEEPSSPTGVIPDPDPDTMGQNNKHPSP